MIFILDARNIEAARNVKQAASVAQEVLAEEVEEVTPVFPAGFHRLPSAMRPPEVTWQKVMDEKLLEKLN